MPTLSIETLTEYEKFVNSIMSANIPQENTELRDLVKKIFKFIIILKHAKNMQERSVVLAMANCFQNEQ